MEIVSPNQVLTHAARAAGGRARRAAREGLWLEQGDRDSL